VEGAQAASGASRPVGELMALFRDLPPVSGQEFSIDLAKVADNEAYFDVYERTQQPAEDESPPATCRGSATPTS
jgi:hypothetical protein